MKVLSIALTFLFISACATVDYTVIPTDQQKVQVVVEVPSTDKVTLFNRAREWVAANYMSSNEVTQMANSDTGRIMGRGITVAQIDSGGLVTTPWKYYHQLKIDVKDNKARLVISDFSHVSTGQAPNYKWAFDPLMASVKPLAAEFESYMLTGGVQSVGSDW